jgi:hypothetical protein
MAKISETELQKRLRKASGGGTNSGPTASKVGSTWEYTTPVLYLAYATALSGLTSAGTITNQSDATGFSMSPFTATGTLRQYRGYLFSKSMYSSGDATDYIWEDTTTVTSGVTYTRYYSENPLLEIDMGDPDNAGTGVTWTSIATGSAVPGTAFWIAEEYTMNGITSAWALWPVKSKDVGTPLASYIITGRNKPTLSSAQWATDTLAAMGSHTGATYSSVKEFGYGTAVVIKYDDGKLFGIYKKNVSGVGYWATPADFIDGDLLVDGTINADKILANSITASLLKVVGTGAITPSTIGAVLPSGVAAAINSNTTTIDGAKITAGSIAAAQIAAYTITASQIASNTITASNINTSGLIAENISATIVSSKTLATSKFRISNQNLFENTDKQGDYFPLMLVGGIEISSCATGTTYHTGSGVTFYGQDHFSGFHTRGVNASNSGTNITFVINAAGQVDDQISLYYRIYSSSSWGSWVCLANVTEPQDSYGTAAVIATYTASMTPSKQIQFATRSVNCSGSKAGGASHKPCYYGGLVVTASNM